MNVHETKNVPTVEHKTFEAKSNDWINVTDFTSVVEKEVDMGFFANAFFDPSSGCGSRGCQRVMYCSCDCNHCSWTLL